MFVLNKSTIVDTVYPLLSEHYRDSRDLDYCVKAWWRNNRPQGGLSLSEEGNIAFQDAEIESYEFEYGPASYMGLLITSVNLDRKLPCPHYVKSKNKVIFIDIYDGRVAMNIALYGSIQRYVSKIGNIFQGE